MTWLMDSPGGHHRIASDYSEKIFEIAGFGTATYGDAFIGLDPIGEPMPTSADIGSTCRGQADAIRRLLDGVDAELWSGSGYELPKGWENCLPYQPLHPLTLQDGVDYAAFLVRTTIDMQRFSDGTLGTPGGIPACGGPIQLLAIERDQPTWVANNSLCSPSQPGWAEGAIPMPG
jgi:hypothetical protein